MVLEQPDATAKSSASASAALVDAIERGINDTSFSSQTPSMMNLREQSVLYQLARSCYRGSGEIVDAGIFLGASTMSFGRGIQDNPDVHAILKQRRRPIHSYELAIATEVMQRIMAKRGQTVKVGEPMTPYIEAEIYPVRWLVTLEIGNILDQATGDEPIEILFLDVLKSEEINDFAVDHFFNRLIPGKSILVQQDYYHGWTPWIHVTMEALSAHFELVGGCGASAYFLHTKALGADDLKAAKFATMPQDDKRERMRRCLARQVGAEHEYLLGMAQARLLADMGCQDEAEATFKVLLAQRERDPQLAKLRVHEGLGRYIQGRRATAASPRRHKS